MALRGDEGSLLQEAQSPEERRQILAESFAGHGESLKTMVRLRLDPRLQSRIDPSDVIQEAYLEASRRIDEYCSRPALSLRLWIRLVVGQKLVDLVRYHTRKRRDARREERLREDRIPDSTATGLADLLLESKTSPSEAAAREEMFERLSESLASMDALDREVLCLRHFEQLSNEETAQVLGIEESAASKRYIRALGKLRKMLGEALA